VERAAVGFRVKSGWAMAVLLVGPAAAPRVADRRRVDLSDPAEPDALQPYHPGLEIHGLRGERETSRLVAAVKRHAKTSLARLFRSYAATHRLAGVGIVAGSLLDPRSIANDHIRAHAEEGRLFRAVIETAAATAMLKSLIVMEKELYERAAAALGQPALRLKSLVATLGESVDGSWRAEEKVASLAAWMILGSRGK
jgi:hypothetical protein